MSEPTGLHAGGFKYVYLNFHHPSFDTRFVLYCTHIILLTPFEILHKIVLQPTKIKKHALIHPAVSSTAFEVNKAIILFLYRYDVDSKSPDLSKHVSEHT